MAYITACTAVEAVAYGAIKQKLQGDAAINTTKASLAPEEIVRE